MSQVLQSTITAEIALDKIVNSGGNLNLAAERLHISKDALIGVIASDPACASQLEARVKTLTLITLFESLQVLSIVFNESVGDLEPKDTAKALAQLATVIAQLTSNPPVQNNINVTEIVYKMLPPAAREALLTLVGDTK